MRRTPLYVAMWALAGAGAVALTTMAVGQVGNQVTERRPAPLSAEDVQEALAAETSSTTVPATSPTAPTTPTTAAPVVTTTTTIASESRTYTLVGGTVTLRFSAAGVTVVVANPRPGFSVDVQPSHGNGVEVEFESADHRSTVEGWWSGGPQDQVEERSESDDEADDDG